MTRALITGGSGFVGQWLARALVRRGDEVTVAGLEPAATPLFPAEYAAARWVRGDVTDAKSVEAMVAAAAPDLVFHLAGVSFVPAAENAPALAWDVNVLGAVRLLSALERRRSAGELDPTVMMVGSSTQYGTHPGAEMPLTEAAAQLPQTIYGASKAAQEIAALQAWRATGIRVICTRSFNHSGPGHPDHFLLPALVRRAVDIRRAGGGVLRIGNGDTVRDHLHVDDVVAAYLALAERGVPGEVYNVASGEGISTRALAADVLLRVGARAEISSDPGLQRATDTPALIGSPAKLVAATGWHPRRTRDDIIDDLIRSTESSNAPT